MSRIFPWAPLPLLLIGCNPSTDSPQLNTGTVMKLTSPAVSEGQAIPKRFARQGDNKSPQLAWADAPTGVKSFALVCDDPDAPMKPWVHWVIWNIPADAHGLEEGVPADASRGDGARQGKNDFGGVGYDGPDPPAGGAHHYFFRLYALDTTLDLPAGPATRQQLDQAMTGHVIGHGQLMGTYQK
jgi:Raf kinase inhibitor-like YbhB/YbcL family protein